MKWDHDAVLSAFAELTGIRFRFLPEDIRRQAATFAQHFSLRDLELVILWTRRKIAAQAGGYSAASLQWRVLMGTPYAGSDFVVFQERLGLAEEEMKRTGWRPAFKLSGAAAEGPAAARKPAAPAPTGEEEARRIREQARALYEKMNPNRGNE